MPKEKSADTAAAGISAPLPKDGLDTKKVLGGLLVQGLNDKMFDGELRVVTKRKPTDEEMENLEFAFKVVKYVKSNGIAIAKDMGTLGIGPGQTNRIWAAEMALERSGEEAKGAVMASDAFFPFDDNIERARKSGVDYIAEPGGSVRDDIVIDCCDKYGIAMAFTGMRLFHH